VAFEPSVVDRPGVPAALYDRYWAAFGQAGQVGTTAWMDPPPGEGILGVDAGRVATIPVDDEGEPIVGADGTIIVVRDIRTGATLRIVETASTPYYAVIVGSLLFWSPRFDASVWVVDLADPASTPRAIVPSSDLTELYGPNADRAPLQISDGGRAVISLVGGDTARATQVIDVATQSLRVTLEGEAADEIAGHVALVYRPDGIALLDTATGHEIGPGIEGFLKASVVGDGEVLVQVGQNDTGASIVAALDLETGEVRQLRVRIYATETLDLVTMVSAPSVLGLLPVVGPTYDARGRIQLPVTLLDPASGQTVVDAFTIGSP
jgi:hypothetical protein